jgi:hypothetical protein
LPYEKIVPQKNKEGDLFWVFFNQTFTAKGLIYEDKDVEGTVKGRDYKDIQNMGSSILHQRNM